MLTTRIQVCHYPHTVKKLSEEKGEAWIATIRLPLEWKPLLLGMTDAHTNLSDLLRLAVRRLLVAHKKIWSGKLEEEL